MSSENSIAPAGLKNFTASLIDYAGLFPPASLELPQAFHNFVYYLQGSYKRMLGKFIIPSAKLSQLTGLMDSMVIKDKVSLSVLGSSGNNTEELQKNLQADMKHITDFLNASGNFASVDAFELRLPKDAVNDNDINFTAELLGKISAGIEAAAGKKIPVFYEISLTANYEQEIIKAAEAISRFNNKNSNGIKCGYKLRTGGTEPSAFPDNAVIAFAVMTCCEYNTPMKCTAGLHHPVRHFNSGVNSVMHGFLNVFSAGILAHSSGMDEGELTEILSEEDPYSFSFNDEGFAWDENFVTNEEIINARRELMISYGSCSFDEPVDDLKSLELLK